MALIDLKSNLAYKGELADNLDNTHQTGFTPNRKQGDETEFVQSVPRGVDSKFNEKIGLSSTTGNTIFRTNQQDNIAGESALTKKTSLFQGETGNTLPPEVKGRIQAAETALEPFTSADKGGLKHLIKQGLLHTQNADSKTRLYNPTSLVRNLKEPTKNFVELPFQTEPAAASKFKDTVQQVIQRTDKTNGYDTARKNSLGINTFNDEDKTPTQRYLKYNITNESVSYGLRHHPLLGDEENLSKDFIKFYIKDIIGDRIIQFPAYLEDITDNSSAEYNPTRYIGKADQVYVYSGYSRSVSFGFKVAALQRGDIAMMWQKIDSLKSLVLPDYSPNVIKNDNDLRPVAPFVELTIGDLYRNQPGFFTGINVTMPQDSTWELTNGYEATLLCNVSLEFTYIGRHIPNLYGTQFDVGTGDVEVGKIKVFDRKQTSKSNFITGTKSVALNLPPEEYWSGETEN